MTSPGSRTNHLRLLVLLSLPMLELNHVHQNDCLPALTTLPDQSIPVVITDPPYPNGAGNFTDDLLDGLIGLYLCCKKAQRHVIFFWRATDVPRPPPGWYEVARHLWHKPDTNSRLPYEAIVVWSRERKYERCRVWRVPILSLRSLGDWKPHPTQKPVQLLRYLVEQYTNEGETVLDPFAGSGSTAVACQQLKRDCISIEKNPEYATIARERLKPRRETQTTLEEIPEEAPSDTEEPAKPARRKR